jgi:hypothetical protein
MGGMREWSDREKGHGEGGKGDAQHTHTTHVEQGLVASQHPRLIIRKPQLL